MYDNGLLKYYQNSKNRDGYLDATSFGVTSDVTNTRNRIQGFFIDGKPYFARATATSKEISKSVKSKNISDAEVLLSQIFNKAGVESAVYLPAKNSYGEVVISNDVSAEDRVVSALDHIYPYFKGTGSIMALPFLSDKKSKFIVNPNELLTRQAMREQTIMRILDTASYNSDRHYQNFFYKLQPTSQQDTQTEIQEHERTKAEEMMNYFRELGKMQADSVIAIDFERSGIVMQNLISRDYSLSKFDNYKNDFGIYTLQREQMMEQIKTNEQLASLIDKSELAETIGSLDPAGVAQDIKETIGYEVEPEMVDILAKSYDEMAEILLQ